MQGHLFKYKTANGTWVALPMAVINIYDVYVAECEAYNNSVSEEEQITIVDKNTYYKTLGNLENILNSFEGLNDARDSLNALVNQLTDGVLPTTMGGTGVSYASFYDFIGALQDNLSDRGFTEDQVAAIISIMSDQFQTDPIITGKLDSNKINSGTAKPDDNTTGDFYFQYQP